MGTCSTRSGLSQLEVVAQLEVGTCSTRSGHVLTQLEMGACSNRSGHLFNSKWTLALLNSKCTTRSGHLLSSKWLFTQLDICSNVHLTSTTTTTTTTVMMMTTLPTTYKPTLSSDSPHPPSPLDSSSWPCDYSYSSYSCSFCSPPHTLVAIVVLSIRRRRRPSRSSVVIIVAVVVVAFMRIQRKQYWLM